MHLDYLGKGGSEFGRCRSANLVECGESVDVGGVDVRAALDEAEHLVLVARRARRQEHATVRELH